MKVLDFNNFINEKMKIVPLSDDDFHKISDKLYNEDSLEGILYYNKDPETIVSIISERINEVFNNINVKYPFEVYCINNIDFLYSNVNDFKKCDYTDKGEYYCENTSLVGYNIGDECIVITAFMYCFFYDISKDIFKADEYVVDCMERIISDALSDMARKYNNTFDVILDDNIEHDDVYSSGMFIRIPFVIDVSGGKCSFDDISNFICDLAKKCTLEFKNNAKIKSSLWQ